MHPKSVLSSILPAAPKATPVAPAPAPNRQFKILQSSRAPAQLTLALRRA
jgi:hypothetical protein